MLEKSKYFKVNTHTVIFFIGVIAGISLYALLQSENAEEEFIMNTSCDSLKIYIDAFDDGKGLFAYWTYETQETVNFKITEKNVEIARNAFDGREC